METNIQKAPNKKDEVNRDSKLKRLDNLQSLVKRIESSKESINKKKPSEFIINEISGKNKKTSTNIQEDMQNITLELVHIIKELEQELSIERNISLDLAKRINEIYEDSLHSKRQMLSFLEIQKNLKKYEALLMIKTKVEFNQYLGKSKLVLLISVYDDLFENNLISQEYIIKLQTYLKNRGILSGSYILSSSEVKKMNNYDLKNHVLIDLMKKHKEFNPLINMILDDFEKHKKMNFKRLKKSNSNVFQSDIDFFNFEYLL